MNHATAPTPQRMQGKKNFVKPHAPHPKPRAMHPPRHVHSQRFVPTCHHCGKIGHIRPMCFQLKPQVHKNKNSYSRKDCDGIFLMMKQMLPRLDEIEKNQNSRPKSTQAWVRKGDITHPLRGSGHELTIA